MNRRQFLRGFGGTAIALPLFESLAPRRAMAAPINRLLVFYFPNGTHGDDRGTDLYPIGSGTTYKLPPPLASLERHRPYLSLLRNIRNTAADLSPFPNHPRGSSCWLTSAKINRSYDDIRAGISMDQVIANQIGGATPLPSLVLANGGPVSSTNEGYSAIYYQNISWRSETTPASRIEDPLLLFDHLFGAKDPAVNTARRRLRMSVLDFAREQAVGLNAQLGGSDRERLDHYLTSIRELETRIDAAQPTATTVCKVPARPGVGLPFAEKIGVMSSLMAAAIACDKTRVATYILDTARSNRNAEFAGVTGAHHTISHHASQRVNIDKLLAINTFYAARFSAFLDLLKTYPDGQGTTLLDNSMVLWGSGLGDSDGHRKDHLPIIIAGRGGGALRPGRVIDAAPNTPIANVHLTLMQHMGVQRPSFGDSTGMLPL
jgi:hypothetical protein